MQEHRQEFQPAEAVAFRRDNRFVAALIAAADTGALAPSDLDADRRALQALGYRLVLLDLEALQPAGAGGRPPSEALRRASLRGPLDALTAMLGAPLASDARSLLWDLGGVGEADRVPPGE
jgi:hypothetical protein